MLPNATPDRKRRMSSRGGPDGRSQEIQRLIGRSLRAVMDLQMLGERSITVDCDVLQADGGTRTASITGAYVALHDALKRMERRRQLFDWPLRDSIAAVSVGLVDGEVCLDLDYVLDSSADVDMMLRCVRDSEHHLEAARLALQEALEIGLENPTPYPEAFKKLPFKKQLDMGRASKVTTGPGAHWVSIITVGSGLQKTILPMGFHTEPGHQYAFKLRDVSKKKKFFNTA